MQARVVYVEDCLMGTEADVPVGAFGRDVPVGVKLLEAIAKRTDSIPQAKVIASVSNSAVGVAEAGGGPCPVHRVLRC